ncbi:hypothetical protein [Caulobacter hibisci]|uniref:Uncharacterized protein n=1 Tax=Caulobacter hibisci TaxID=2035993 RepID=A0ABS0SS30_9CAUL|nr:hypothetical protein [Caulobacter hibisci]MBI1682368.1 hypothetical protein [Caulobacter hibisci]
MSPPAGARANPDVSVRLGTLEGRMESLERAQAATAEDAREARDLAKEIIVILREQNALERVSEVRSEARKLVGDLREDVVAANTGMRTDLKSIRTDVDALMNLRTQAQGAVKGGKWVIDALKIIAGAGGGAIILKLLEVIK